MLDTSIENITDKMTKMLEQFEDEHAEKIKDAINRLGTFSIGFSAKENEGAMLGLSAIEADGSFDYFFNRMLLCELPPIFIENIISRNSYDSSPENFDRKGAKEDLEKLAVEFQKMACEFKLAADNM